LFRDHEVVASGISVEEYLARTISRNMPLPDIYETIKLVEAMFVQE
jgi:hypothetical protein